MSRTRTSRRMGALAAAAAFAVPSAWLTLREAPASADPAPAGSGVAVIRLLDAVTSSPAAVVDVDGASHSMTADELGQPIVLGSGARALRVSSGELGAAGSTDLGDGCTAVVVAGQPGGPHHPLTIAAIPECPIPRIPDGDASVRLLLATGSADGPAALGDAGTPAAVAMPFGASARFDVPAGSARLTLSRPGRPGILASLDENLVAGTAYTVLVVGGSALLPVVEHLAVDGVQPPVAVPAGVRINTDGPAPWQTRPVVAATSASRSWASRAARSIAVVALVAVAVIAVDRTRRYRPLGKTPIVLAVLIGVLAVMLGATSCGARTIGGARRNSEPPHTAGPVGSSTTIARGTGPAGTGPTPSLGTSPAPQAGASPGPHNQLQVGSVRADVVPVATSGLPDLPSLLGPNVVGWVDGSDPIDAPAGTTALVGHVSFGGKPAVFADLASSKPGEVVRLAGDGVASTYRVDTVSPYPKGSLPGWLWDPRPIRTLLLISCGGPIDPSTGLHELNVVVTAHLVPSVSGQQD
ncbi:MAG: hypothetical protein ACRDZ8_18735 [Acidimicrobiales bacterium]